MPQEVKHPPVLPDPVLRLVPCAGTRHRCSFPSHIHVSCEPHHGLPLNNCHWVPVASVPAQPPVRRQGSLPTELLYALFS